MVHLVAHARLGLNCPLSRTLDISCLVTILRVPKFVGISLTPGSRASICVLFSLYGYVGAKIGATQLPLLCVQFSLIITNLMYNSE